MKKIFSYVFIALVFLAGNSLYAQTKQLYMDVHYLKPGSVSFADVMAAHAKDLKAQDKYNVQFLKYWLNEKSGAVYCLSNAADSNAISSTHKEAHGLIPQEVNAVVSGKEAAPVQGLPYFLDVHVFGPGNVTAAAVVAAHEKDLAVQKKHGVHCINYWVNEEKGIVYCLAQAKKADDLIATHKEAHGLLPTTVMEVKQGE